MTKPPRRRGRLATSGESKHPGGGDPIRLVNATGFAFQLAVEELVHLSNKQHGWEITSREHGWRDHDDTPRFIDLVLTKDQIDLVVECKRHRGAQWVFLVPDPPKGRRAVPRRHFRAAYLRNEEMPDGGWRAITSLSEFQLDPLSWESSFCAVPGGLERDPPMLDRICAELTRSADAILAQQLSVNGRPYLPPLMLSDRRQWFALPLIVTTAELQVCRFDPSDVSVHTGEVDTSAAQLEQVNAVRYRKSFDVEPYADADSIRMLEHYAQRTVCVVTAAHLVEWLENFSFTKASYNVR
jgi:hypothetical protein